MYHNYMLDIREREKEVGDFWGRGGNKIYFHSSDRDYAEFAEEQTASVESV